MGLTRPLTRSLIRPLTRAIGEIGIINVILSSDNLEANGALSVTGGSPSYQLYRDMGVNVAGIEGEFSGLNGDYFRSDDGSGSFYDSEKVNRIAYEQDVAGQFSITDGNSGNPIFVSENATNPNIPWDLTYVPIGDGTLPAPTVTRNTPQIEGSTFTSDSTFPSDATAGFAYLVRDANGNESNVLIIPSP